jgi:simple sugar transport system ATP-binding protein
LSKSFPGVRAADAVDFSIGPGEVVGLIGENGAGKTTLVRMLSGLETPDQGEIKVRGAEVRFPNPAAARSLGIGMVLQHFSLVPTLTALENLLIGDPEAGEWGFVRTAKARRRYERLQEQSGLRVDLDVPVSQLSVGERQRLEILKCLRDELDIIILDEPTAVINVTEIAALMDLVRSWAAAGKAVILISHKLDELLEVTERIVVMRRGAVVANVETEELTVEMLAAAMVGDEQDTTVRSALDGRNEGRKSAPLRAVTQPVLRMRGVTVPAPTSAPNLRVEDLDLEVHPGRILGVAGIEGNGQRTLVDVILGVASAAAGSVELCGRDVTRLSARERLKDGLAIVHEDRKTISGIGALSVFDNLVLRQLLLERHGRLGLVRWRDLKSSARGSLREYGIKATLDVPFSALSGGNQQRVVLAREIACEPALLLAEHPTQGLDIHGAIHVRSQLAALRDRGTAILLISSELDEVLELADDIVVMQRGRIVGLLSSERATRQAIAQMMVGGAA